MQAPDSLDSYLTGPKSVRDRDMRIETLRKTVPIPQPCNQYRLWQTIDRPGPADKFKPNGSFAPLMGGGKIQVGAQGQVRQQTEPHHLPGYTGYIKGNQHISGRRFSEVTRRSHQTSLEDLCTQESIPSDPQRNMKIPHQALEDRYMYGVTKNKLQNVPGYTGHLPGVRDQYAQTYGRVSRLGWDTHHQKFPNNPQERQGYAYTMLERKPNHISSDPIPGSNCVSKPPKHCIPVHLDHLRYFAI